MNIKFKLFYMDIIILRYQKDKNYKKEIDHILTDFNFLILR